MNQNRQSSALVFATCFGLLLANDWVLKRYCIGPSILRGLLSDFAGLVLVPLPIWIFATLACRFARGRKPRRHVANTLVAIACAFVAVSFLSIKLSHVVAQVAEQIWPWPEYFGKPRIVSDPLDIIALPMIAAGYLVGRVLFGVPECFESNQSFQNGFGVCSIPQENEDAFEERAYVYRSEP